jgi:hypothetical protein
MNKMKSEDRGFLWELVMDEERDNGGTGKRGGGG